jgi:Leucine-rich repeat (LRR) protein
MIPFPSLPFHVLTHPNYSDVSHNTGMTGTIPETLGTLPLVRLNMMNCSFTGTIPRNLASSASLQFLSLATNRLQGEIPKVLFSAANLVQLHLQENALSGPLPTEMTIPASPKLTNLWLHKNQLTGPIPPVLGNFSNLQFLSFSENPQLTGALPGTIFDIASLRYFAAEKCALTGTIPVNIGNLKAIAVLNLRSNKLTGTIPESIGLLSTTLQQLYDFLPSSSRHRGLVTHSFTNPPSLRHCAAF